MGKLEFQHFVGLAEIASRVEGLSRSLGAGTHRPVGQVGGETQAYVVLDLAGYHLKNAYAIEHREAINIGRPPRDEKLARAEEHFLGALSSFHPEFGRLNPQDSCDGQAVLLGLALAVLTFVFFFQE